MKKILLIFAALACAVATQAQELGLTDFKEDLSDIEAQRNQVVDINDVPCALVKIDLSVPGAEFEGDIVKVVPQTGGYWVYLVEGSTYLNIMTPEYPALRTEFDPLASKHVYIMKVMPNGQSRIQSITLPGTPGITVNGRKQGGKQEVTFNMVRIDKGMFKMGATPEQESDESDENPVHWVIFSKDFYIGETEVSQALWEYVMEWNNSYNKAPNAPVENITIADAWEFIRKLNQITGLHFRLPSEAEWEYAARGGRETKHTKYSGSNDPGEVAWFYDNSGNHPHDVKSKEPNELGLYNMSGNVWEFCRDFKDSYPSGEVTDYICTKKSKNRVRRGGGWDSEAHKLRTAYRRRVEETDRDRSTGFRLALDLD